MEVFARLSSTVSLLPDNTSYVKSIRVYNRRNARAYSNSGVRTPMQKCPHQSKANQFTLRGSPARSLSAFATMSQVSPPPPALMSRDLPLLYTVRIILRLRALRTSLGLSACPPRPPVNADENFLGLSIYPGSMTEVTSQDDLHFGSLGRLFFIIETRLNGDVVRKRAVFDIARIPRRILETDQELNELLVSRNNSINASSSSPPRSTAVSADTEAIASASPSNEFPVQDTTLDDEHDASEPHFPSRRVQPSGRAERRHAPYCMSHRLDRSQPSQDAHEHQMSMGITVTILAWTKESYRQTTATLAVGNGHCMTLSLVTRALNELFDGRADSSHLERFVPHKGWLPILLNTPFVVNDGNIISLKPTATVVDNWHIHVAHLY